MYTNSLPYGVHIHSLLAWRGGAARVASLLGAGLCAAEVPCTSSCEIADDGQAHTVVEPQDVSLAVPIGSILHLHGTQAWAVCLQAASSCGASPLITVHDCSLLTGGCPYPLDCLGVYEGCYTPCPRGFADAAAVQRLRLAAVQQSGCHLISPSRWLKKMVKQVLPKIACSVIPNGVEVPDVLVTREYARKRLGVAQHARLVLFMAHGGEQAAYKCGDRWRDVWSAIRASVDGAVCYMVGGEVLQAEDSLVSWPYVDRETVQLFLAAADCFAYPTLADNHPLVILEALSVGCPVVSFAVGGVPEQIADRKNGLLVPAGDWQGFSEACIAILRSTSLRRELSLAGKSTFVRHFTDGRMVHDHLHVYAQHARVAEAR